jgi:tetratricopeptide (TPR) repeat protein
MDLRAIGRELNVRYILEGSVQRGRERMRVAAQLIDAESGGHIWAERFDQPVADLFELQDAIVGRIAATLNVEIVAAEARRAERRPTPDSIDLYFQAAAWLHRGVTRENVARARPLLARALELDPENAYALVSEAIACAAIAASSFSDERIALLASAEACAAKALSLAPEYEAAQYAIGLVFSLTNRAAQGVAACERALALNRNFVPAHGVLSFGKFLLGRGEETEGHIQDALRLSPRDSDAFIWMAIAGAAALLLARDEAAANWLRRSIHAHADYPQAHVLLAAALGNLGRLDDARREVETALTLDPTFSIERFRKSSPSDNAVYLEQRERVIDGLRKAGAPEG